MKAWKKHWLWRRLDDGSGHDEVCARLHRAGFLLDDFAGRVSAAIHDPRWRNDGDPLEDGSGCHDELIERIATCRLRPDAFRVRVEGPENGWGHRVLAIDVIEVVHSNPPSQAKAEYYENLWWEADSSHTLSFRFWWTTHGRTFHAICPAYSIAGCDVEGPMVEAVDFPTAVSLDELLALRMPSVPSDR